jgi:hypothetical protein
MAFEYSTSPTAVQTVGSEAFFTELQLFKDVPQVRRKLQQKYGIEKSFYLMLKEMGLGTGVKGPEFAHYEDDEVINTIVVGAVTTVSTGVNTPVVFSLKAESMKAVTLNGVATKQAFIQEQDLIALPGTDDEEAIVTSVNRNVDPIRVTVTPVNPALDLAAYVTANRRFYISGSAFAEGTGPAKSIVPIQTRWANTTQIAKARYTETGSSMSNELPWDPHPSNKNIKLLKYGHIAERVLYHKVSMNLINGKRTANVKQDGGELGYNPVVKTSQGLSNYAQTEGANITHTAGAIDLSHFDSISDRVKQNRMGTDLMLSMMGDSYRTEMENLLFTTFDKDSLKYFAGKFKPEILQGSDPEDYFANIGFSGLKKGGIRYVFQTVNEWHNQNSMGAEGYDFRDRAIHMPYGTLKNKGNDIALPSFGYRYKELGTYSREMEYFNTGSANIANPTDSIDVQRLDLISDIGFEGIGGSQWVNDEKA